jgi:hypothetical protein
MADIIDFAEAKARLRPSLMVLAEACAIKGGSIAVDGKGNKYMILEDGKAYKFREPNAKK